MHCTRPLWDEQTDTIFFASAGHEKSAETKREHGSEDEKDGCRVDKIRTHVAELLHKMLDMVMPHVAELMRTMLEST